MLFKIEEITNEKILKAVKLGQNKAKLMIEELGMAELFKKHKLWGKEISIVGVDDGFRKNIEDKLDNCNIDDDDSDLDEEDIGSNSTVSQI